MTKRKKVVFFLFFSFFIIFSFFKIQAADLILTVICNFIYWVRDLLLTIGILSLIFGGYKILTAGGDPGRMEDAKKIIIIALVGMAVIWGIAYFMQGLSIPVLCPILAIGIYFNLIA